MKRLAIITSHPIQYNAPLFKLLAQRRNLILKVFYTWGESVLQNKYDPGFRRNVEWDIPLLDGYEYSFPRNKARRRSSDHFFGINNPELNREIKLFNPTSLLVFGWNNISHLKCLRYFHGKVPIIFRGDSTLIDEKANLKKVLRTYFLRWVYRHVDFALYAGQNNLEYFLRHGLQHHQLVLAPHAIDIARYKLNSEQLETHASEWKKSLGIPCGELTVLYAGKFKDCKNPDFLLAVAEFLKDLPIRIIFVGNGPIENEIKRRALKYPKIIYIDFQNQSLMPIVYRLGDIFIMPSKCKETWGLAINEAMACGCAIAASKMVGGAVDLVSERNGFLFDLDEVKECSEFIASLNGNRIKLKEMKQFSMKEIEKFSFDMVVEAIENLTFDDPTLNG